jgi:hypothetical protein
MKLARGLQITAAAATCAATALPSALAGGEPKNGSPFTRAADHASAGLISARFSATRAFPAEPKNVAPFTRLAGNGYDSVYALHQIARLATSTPTAEPKNEWPFTRVAHVNG